MISRILEINLPKIIFIDDVSFYFDGVIHISLLNDFNKMLFLGLHELSYTNFIIIQTF